MKEIWKDVFGYNGEYQVSNLGRVRSFKRCNPKIKSPFDNRLGYLRVGLWKNNKCQHYYVHILVAKAFIGNLYNKPEVDHKDDNRKNNKAVNLKWVTRSENVKKTYKEKNIRINYSNVNEDFINGFDGKTEEDFL